MFYKNRKNGSDAAENLEAMIAAAREGGRSEGLSADCRERILNRALRGAASEGPLPGLFTPTRRLVVAGALPVVLAFALLVGFEQGVQPPRPPAEGAPQVAVFKRGDRVFFDIRNGDRQHYVCRSTQADRFDSSCGVPVTDGAYEDGLQDQASLVFYRID